MTPEELMNNINPQIPPQIPPLQTHPSRLPLGENPDDRAGVPNAVSAVEAILRAPRRIMFQLRQPGAGGLILRMLLLAAVCSLIYGVVVATFANDAQQYWRAPVKIA